MDHNDVINWYLILLNIINFWPILQCIKDYKQSQLLNKVLMEKTQNLLFWPLIYPDFVNFCQFLNILTSISFAKMLCISQLSLDLLRRLLKSKKCLRFCVYHWCFYISFFLTERPEISKIDKKSFKTLRSRQKNDSTDFFFSFFDLDLHNNR